MPAAPADSRYSRRRFLELGTGTAFGVALGGTALAGCGPFGGGGSGGGGGRKLIGLCAYADDDYCRCVASGVLAALAGTGYRLIARQSAFSAARELANVERLAARKISGLVIVPVAVETATRGAQVAQQRGIRVATALSPGPGQGDKFFAGAVDTHSEDGGRQIGRWLDETVTGETGVIVVQGLLGQGVSEPLDRGLAEAIGATRGKLRVVFRGPGNLDGGEAVGVVRAGLAAHPNAKVVVDYAAVMGDAIAGYLRSAGKEDIVHITNEAGPATARWLRTPYLRATRYYSPADTGRKAVRIVLDALEAGDMQADPFSPGVDASIRTARDLSRADPYCVPELAARVRFLPPAEPAPGLISTS